MFNPVKPGGTILAQATYALIKFYVPDYLKSKIMPFFNDCQQCLKFGPPHPCRGHAECLVVNPAHPKGSKIYDPGVCSICANWSDEAKKGDSTAKTLFKKYVQKLRTTFSKSKSKNAPPTEFISIFLDGKKGLEVLNLLGLPSGPPAKKLSRASSMESCRSPRAMTSSMASREFSSPRAIIKPVLRDCTLPGMHY